MTATPPRRMASRELNAQALSAWNLPLADCLQHEFTMAVTDDDRSEDLGQRFETWPQEVRDRFVLAVEQWLERSPTRRAAAQTCGVFNRNFVLILHHVEKAAQ